MKKNFTVFFMLFLIIPFFGKGDLTSITTTLVIVEESENENMPLVTPFTDGVLDSLWQRPYIFFDMRLDAELEMLSENEIDVKPYFGSAKGAGADSILIIKCKYDFTQVDNIYNIKMGKIPYVLYSLNSFTPLRTGVVDIDIDNNITAQEKRIFLKNLGKRILNLIYSSKG